MIKAKSYSRTVVAKPEAPKRFRFDDLAIILAVVAISIFAVNHFMSANSEASLAARAQAHLKGDIATAIKAYKNDTGSYPNSRQGLNALIEAPANVSNWKGPYLSADALKDPWNMSYQYAFPGRHSAIGQYDVWSMGPDKLNATADDVGNW